MRKRHRRAGRRHRPLDCAAAQDHAPRGIEIRNRHRWLEVGYGLEDRLLVFIFILVLILVFVLRVRIVVWIKLILLAKFRKLFGHALAAAIQRADLRVVHDDAKGVLDLRRRVRTRFPKEFHAHIRARGRVFRMVRPGFPGIIGRSFARVQHDGRVVCAIQAFRTLHA